MAILEQAKILLSIVFFRLAHFAMHRTKCAGKDGRKKDTSKIQTDS